MNNSTITDCDIFQLKKNFSTQGNLTAVSSNNEVPFNIKRIYYLYDVPGGETRGGHAHKQLEQFIISASGSFDVILDDGNDRKTVSLNRSSYGLYVPQMIWREIVNFSTGAICLVLASNYYNENEYIRKHQDFVDLKKHVNENVSISTVE